MHFAAHCGGIWSSGALYGTIELSGAAGRFVGVDQEVPNPAYDPNADTGDVMLVKLVHPILDVPPVQLNFDPAVPVVGQDLRVIGFGDTKENGTFAAQLMQTTVPVVSFQSCNDYFGGIVDATMVCAGGAGGRDSCQGDSGGPLMDLNNGQVSECCGMSCLCVSVCFGIVLGKRHAIRLFP
jgi:Trypsin